MERGWQELAYTEAVQIQGEMLVLRYVPLDAARQWERNPKKHDLQKLVESMETYGFKDPQPMMSSSTPLSKAMGAPKPSSG